MTEVQTLLLGFIAGVTILLGLPVGRMRATTSGLRMFLNAFTIGILLFLVWDVLTNAYHPLDLALAAVHQHGTELGMATGYGLLFLGGLGAGLGGLVAYERWLSARATRPARGPGAMATARVPAGRSGDWSAARRLALLIAVGIGLHNLGEGLAIGASAATGAISLATLLVIGFALHNATEGFGIVAPLAAAGERPSWGFLLAVGGIGGGPTVLGTAVGRQFSNAGVSILFLTLAAGSLIYVVVQLMGVALRGGGRGTLYLGIMLGLTAGFVTDMVVSAGGA